MVIIKQRSDPVNKENKGHAFCQKSETIVRIISITERPPGSEEARGTGRDFH